MNMLLRHRIKLLNFVVNFQQHSLECFLDFYLKLIFTAANVSLQLVFIHFNCDKSFFVYLMQNVKMSTLLKTSIPFYRIFFLEKCDPS